MRLAKELTAGINQDINKQIIVEAMKGMSEFLATKIVAKAFEGQDNLDLLNSIGVDGASR